MGKRKGVLFFASLSSPHLETITSTHSSLLLFPYRNIYFYLTTTNDIKHQDEFSIFNGRHALDVHGYVLVYSVTSRQSFDMVTVIRDKILNFTGTDWAPIVLVGNKTDLQGQRQVSKEEGDELASKWKCLNCETSAKTKENIGNMSTKRRGMNVCAFYYFYFLSEKKKLTLIPPCEYFHF